MFATRALGRSSVLVMVQLPFSAMATQLAWFAV
jgi:hypothetical protein